MPNYVYNTLTVSGTKDDITKFYNDNKKDDHELSFDKAIPEPDNIDWYNWRIKNWGCKWDASEVDFTMIDKEPCKGIYTFTTPWSPPMKWLETVSTKYPDLIFYIRFEDEGFNFFGMEKYHNGVNTLIDDYKYDDVINYLMSNCECYPEDLLAIAKKYNYTKDNSGDYDEMLEELEELSDKLDSPYKFKSSILESIIIDLLN